MKKIYSDLKMFRFNKTLDALVHNKIIAPVHIRIKPTNVCNHNCWYCAYHVGDVSLGEDMVYRDSIPYDKMNEIVSDIIDMGVSAVTFSGGGEPLLYKRLPEIIKRLSINGVQVASLTNGMNLKGKMADSFAKYASWVRVSLDGYDNESYSKARGVRKGEFDKLMTNLYNFSKRKSKCMLSAVYIVDNNNFRHIYDICKKLKDSGVSSVKISSVIVGNTGLENSTYHSPIKREVRNQIILSKELEDSFFSINDSYHDLDDRMWDKNYTTCPNLLYSPVIGADSKVYTCHDKAYTQEGLLGNLENQTFKSFWLSPENEKQVYSFSPCVSCNHHCVANSKNLLMHDFLLLNHEHISFT
jgi:MoaA/NifB/PqqE/SkfB family radical SAM enzyme